ncbi:MAG: hypothetical protein II881_02775 [Oscillospiraceae bacterium]|nr:hypothetical protein [Oscillospiraceae bacterium]
MAFLATNAIKIQRSAAVTEELEVTENGTYTPSSGVDGFDSVTVNVSGGDPVWKPVTPINLGSGSFISSGNSLEIGRTDWPNYYAVALDLQTLAGKIIYIDNSDNNRNYWGLYTSLSTGQAITYPSTRELQSNGKLIFYANDFYRLAQYLVYDFTTSSQSQPAISAMNVTAPSA